MNVLSMVHLVIIPDGKLLAYRDRIDDMRDLFRAQKLGLVDTLVDADLVMIIVRSPAQLKEVGETVRKYLESGKQIILIKHLFSTLNRDINRDSKKVWMTGAVKTYCFQSDLPKIAATMLYPKKSVLV